MFPGLCRPGCYVKLQSRDISGSVRGVEGMGPGSKLIATAKIGRSAPPCRAVPWFAFSSLRLNLHEARSAAC